MREVDGISRRWYQEVCILTIYVLRKSRSEVVAILVIEFVSIVGI